MAKKKKDAETTVTLAVKGADGQTREATLPALEFDERLKALTKKANDELSGADEKGDPTAPPKADWEHKELDELHWPEYLREGAETSLFENIAIHALDVVELRHPITCPDHVAENQSRVLNWLVLSASPATTQGGQDLALLPLDHADRPLSGLLRAYLIRSEDVTPVVGRVARNRKRLVLEDFCRMRWAWFVAGSICHPTESERSQYLADGAAKASESEDAQAEADSLKRQAKDAQAEADGANASAIQFLRWATSGRPWPYKGAPEAN